MTHNGRNRDFKSTIVTPILWFTISSHVFRLIALSHFCLHTLQYSYENNLYILTTYYHYLLEHLCTSATIGYCVTIRSSTSITHILKQGYKIAISFNKLITHQNLQFILHFHILPHSSSLR